jgi:hypothetical protein
MMNLLSTELPQRLVFRGGVPPMEVSEPDAGPAVEFPTADGPTFAVLMMGAVTNDAAVGVTFEQSHDGITWVDVPDAEIPAQSAAGTVVATSFVRDRRYVRCRYDLTGEEGAAADVAVLLAQPAKIV